MANRSPITINGTIVGVMSIFHELERYERISEYLQKYRNLTRQVETLIDSSYDGIFVTDGQGNGIRSNAAYDRITGVDSSEFIGQNMRDLEKYGHISESVTLKVLKSMKIETITQILRTGKEVLVTGSPIFNDEGEIIMVLTNVRDMTELNEMSRELQQFIEMTSAYKRQLQELQRSSLCDNSVVAVSESMQEVYEIVMRVSNKDASVFIHGETGVGKDRIAEEIHQLSNRSKTGVLVKINCGAIPETLLESELFGYDKGAFTGAKKEGKPGLFEIADGGTLFLDEIDSMPLVLQSKLLRVVQNFEIRRLGGTTSKKVDVRLICATNQDMKELFLKKKFRSDLYYRLNVIPIHIRPLRERPEDIPRFIQVFLARFNQKHSVNKTMSRDCREALMKWTWPGNVRELANVVERLVVLTPSDYIMSGDIPPELLDMSNKDSMSGSVRSLKEQMMHLETEIISKAIKKYGNARRAARILKVNPSTISRKLKSLKNTVH